MPNPVARHPVCEDERSVIHPAQGGWRRAWADLGDTQTVWRMPLRTSALRRYCANSSLNAEASSAKASCPSPLA